MTAIFRRLLPIAALLALLAAPAVAQTVTYTIVSDSLEKTFEEPMFAELEKITGVRLEPRLFPEDDIPQHYALMAAADDMPDLAARLPGNLSLQLGQEGLLMGLRGLEEYRPNFVNTIEQYKFDFDTFLARAGTADGDYFVSPSLSGWYKNIKNAIIYRSDIFAEHGIEVPTTSEELADVLKQLKELYPDSIPYMTFRDWWWPFFVMFGVYDFPQGEDYYHQTAYQDALRYIADLYAAGAIDQEFPTRQYAEWNKALNEEASTFMEGTHGYSFHGNAPTLLGISSEENAAAAADPFGPAGQAVLDKLNAKFAFMSIPTHGSAKRVSPPSSNVNPFGIGFNANIEMPEVAAKWLDFFYSEYGSAWTGTVLAGGSQVGQYQRRRRRRHVAVVRGRNGRAAAGDRGGAGSLLQHVRARVPAVPQVQPRVPDPSAGHGAQRPDRGAPYRRVQVGRRRRDRAPGDAGRADQSGRPGVGRQLHSWQAERGRRLGRLPGRA